MISQVFNLIVCIYKNTEGEFAGYPPPALSSRRKSGSAGRKRLLPLDLLLALIGRYGKLLQESKKRIISQDTTSIPGKILKKISSEFVSTWK